MGHFVPLWEFVCILFLQLHKYYPYSWWKALWKQYCDLAAYFPPQILTNSQW